MDLHRPLFVFLALIALTSFTKAWASTSLIDEDLPWQVNETEHFRVYFTPELKEWALAASAEMEAFQAQIEQKHKLSLDKKIEAVVVDPYNLSNGFALPASNHPVMTLFATPPQSDQLANNPGWHQFLSVHEYIHLVHLSQKSRNRWRELLARWIYIYDLSQPNMPQWVTEGYATLMESKLTGRGRMFDHYQEAQLQQMVYQGRFPTYSKLKGRLAYSLGSRFISWLETEYGEEKLNQVWTRLYAVKKRSFKEAFEGVYLKPAEILYQEFAIQYIEKTLEQGKGLSESQSELWFQTKKKITMPAVSPDGSQLALIVRDKEEGHFLCVLETQENEKAKNKFVKQNKKLLERDPLDVPDQMPLTFPKKEKECLNAVSYPWMQNPRWQGESQLLFTSLVRGVGTSALFELQRWDLSTNKVETLTQGLGVKRFDVSQDGQSVVAVTNRHGFSQLVQIDLASGNLSELTPRSLAQYYDFPRLRPNQNQLAYLNQLLNEKWQLKIRDLGTGEEQVVAMPEGYQYLSFPEWSLDGKSLVFVASEQNRLQLYQYQLSSNTLFALSSGKQSLFWPTPLDETSWLHLAPGQKGADLFKLDLSKLESKEVMALTSSADAELAYPALLNRVEVAKENGTEQIRDYGLGEQKGSLTFGASLNSASAHLAEIGYHSADLLQRMTWQVNLSRGDDLEGGSFVWSWNPWAVDFQVRGYHFEAELEQATSLEESGLMVEASTLAWKNLNHSLDLRAHFYLQDLEARDQTVTRFSLKPQGQWLWPTWKLSYKAEGAWLQGFSDDLDWRGYDLDFELNYQRSNTSRYGALLSWKKRSVDGAHVLDLGGFRSNLIAQEVNPNRVLSPDLAFASQSGDEHKGIKLFVAGKGSEFFYKRQQLDEREPIHSFGLAVNRSFDLGISLLNGMTLEGGLARVKGNEIDDSTEFWLGVYQPW